jgi:hypothetical protein
VMGDVEGVAEPSPAFNSSSSLGALSYWGQRIFQGVSGTVDGGYNAAKSATLAVTERASALVTLAQLTGTSALSQVYAVIVDPIALRGGAIVKALLGAGGLAAVAGLVTTVVFAPAAPFVAGLVLLSAPAMYTDILAENISDAERARKLRTAGADEAFIAAWSALKGQQVIRIETDYMTTECDVVSKVMDGTILVGRFTGQHLSSLSIEQLQSLRNHSPDTQTTELLDRYLTTRKSAVVSGAVTNEATPANKNSDYGVVAAGLELLFTIATLDD